MNRKPKKPASRPRPTEQVKPLGLRVIGGKYRGRKLEYSGDRGVRPMKDRVREAIFNLVGVESKESHAIDLFAGTGAVGLEALSRGATRATFIERHFPTAAVLQSNLASLGIGPEAAVVTSDTFIWWRGGPDLGTQPWVVFCSPPYDYFIEREADILALITGMLTAAPVGSVMVVESDLRFLAERLPAGYEWDVRQYTGARVAIARKR